MIALHAIRRCASTVAIFSLGVVSQNGDWRWMASFLVNWAAWMFASHLLSRGWDRI